MLSIGKKYIGKHLGNLNDNYMGSGVIFSKALKKYGKDSFKRDILYYEYENEKNLYLKEIDIINQYNAVDSLEYYNCTNVSPEIFKKFENCVDWCGKIKRAPASDKTKTIMSEDRKGRLYYNNGIIEKRLNPVHHVIPDGFKRGRLNQKPPPNGKGSFTYNNGIINKRFYPSDVIPEGWVHGKIKRIQIQ
jgi:hypothetical protein